MGDHIRKRRLDLGRFQKDVGRLFGVDTTTVTNWEKNRTKPTLRLMPAVIRFLGYSPLPETDSLGERLKTYRRTSGTTQKRLAAILGVDPTMLARWESGKLKPDEKQCVCIDRLPRSDNPSAEVLSNR
jgi:transcriptional regulator with XRE-family HTH domain